MKNKFVILIIVLGITPQIVSASWYDFMNPLSWFTREKVNYQSQYQSKDTEEQLDINDQMTPPTTTSTELEVIGKTVIKEVKVPMEKTITRMVDNPELQKQIAILKTEKDQLKSSLEYAIKKIAELNSKIDELNKTISNKNTEHQIAILNINEKYRIDKEQAVIDAKKQGEIIQKQKETNFFENLIISSDYSGDAGTRLCSTWSYTSNLDTLNQTCKRWREIHFPTGQR